MHRNSPKPVLTSRSNRSPGERRTARVVPLPVRATRSTLRSQINNVLAFPGAAGTSRTASRAPHRVPFSLDKSAGAHGDALEGTPSGAVATALSHATADRSPGSVCVLRVSEYRVLEGTFGRAVGRQLTRLIGERLANRLRPGDVLEQVAEDEFAIVLEGLEEPEAVLSVARRLLESCAGLHVLAGLRLHVDAHIGIARYPTDATEPAELMRYARIALHESDPQSPSPFHFFSRGLLSQLHERVWMAAELEEALEQGRFVLHYQPLVAIDGQRIVGIEALLRMVSTSGELIGPDRFIPLAEEMGLIGPIGDWVLREACQQLRRWRENSSGPLRMAVNVSPRQLADEGFVERVSAAVTAAGIHHSDLELEITEGQMVSHLPRVERAFQALSRLGVRIAVDDFGTGYSSLAYLARLPLHTVKIDRAFLTDVPQDPKAARVVAAIIAMAKELRLEVTAEGIEREAQYRFLVEAGCHLGQGYGFARPKAAEELWPLLQAPAAPRWKPVDGA